jgi:hypothetical protein
MDNKGKENSHCEKQSVSDEHLPVNEIVKPEILTIPAEKRIMTVVDFD